MYLLILSITLMPRKTNVLSISLPNNLTKAVDILSKETDQTRSELIRNALREYVSDMQEDRKRFLEAYKETRKEKTISLESLRIRYKLD